ncbi:MAG: hypothetical protein JWQ96_1288 [Segetibacter sp.]|nr:hypothetical protein [Segetibacter sp.]
MRIELRILLSVWLALSFLTSCSVATKHSRNAAAFSGLKFLGKYELTHNQQLKGTTIGGLSGIDYDKENDLYYFICDDGSAINPARFYTAKIGITPSGISRVDFINVTTLLQPTGTPYPSAAKDPFNTPDAEAIRYNPITQQLIWTSEGERIVKKDTILTDPSLTAITKQGGFLYAFPIPQQLRMQAAESGPRKNAALEGLTFADNYKTMYTSVEEPLYNDGPRAGLKDTTTWTRIIKYNVKTRKPIAQYAYHLDPVVNPSTPAEAFKINGVVDVLSVGRNQLIIVERSFSVGISNSSIRVYLADLSNASDINGNNSLIANPPGIPVAKRLLLDMDKLGTYIDNVEGVTFGPLLPNGHRTLVFVADNNFDAKQRTQFILFEVL